MGYYGFVDKKELNDLFIRFVQSNFATPRYDKIAEFANALSDYVRTYIEEEAFARQILPPRAITLAETLLTGFGGTRYVLRTIDRYRVNALVVDDQGNPTAEFYQGEDYRIVFNFYETPEYTVDTRKARIAFPIDFHALLEEKIAFEMARMEDRQLMRLVFTALGYDLNTGELSPNYGTKNILDLRGYYGTSVSKGITPEMITLAKQRFESYVANRNETNPANFQWRPRTHKLYPTVILMNTYDAEDFTEWSQSDIGSILRSEFFEAYNRPTIKQLRRVVTLNTTLVPRGRMYLFTDPQYLGHFFILEEAKTLVDLNVYNHYFRIKGEAYWGMNIGNVEAILEVVFTPRGSRAPASLPPLTLPEETVKAVATTTASGE